jgi:hypothetical protein
LERGEGPARSGRSDHRRPHTGTLALDPVSQSLPDVPLSGALINRIPPTLPRCTAGPASRKCCCPSLRVKPKARLPYSPDRQPHGCATLTASIVESAGWKKILSSLHSRVAATEKWGQRSLSPLFETGVNRSEESRRISCLLQVGSCAGFIHGARPLLFFVH